MKKELLQVRRYEEEMSEDMRKRSPRSGDTGAALNSVSFSFFFFFKENISAKINPHMPSTPPPPPPPHKKDKTDKNQMKRKFFRLPVAGLRLKHCKSAKLPWYHNIKLSFWSLVFFSYFLFIFLSFHQFTFLSSCLVVFSSKKNMLSFCLDIVLIKCLEGSQVSKVIICVILKWQRQRQPRVGIELVEQLKTRIENAL